MDKFAESVHQTQVDNDSPCVRRVIDEICTHVGRGGLHRPVVLQVEMQNRIEILYILRQVMATGRVGQIRMQVSPSELIEKFLTDPQPHSCFYAAGDFIPHTMQGSIVAKYGHDVERHLTPPVFVVITHLHPNALCEQGEWRRDFRDLFKERIVIVPTAVEREPIELVELFQSAMLRASKRVGKKKFKIDKGALDLLTMKWAMEPPPSLDYVLAAANKTVAVAGKRLAEIARAAAMRTVSKTRLTITSKDVINAIMPDSPLADRAPGDAPIY
ncbi:MAG: hypothetical protein NUW08_01185 [Candidatus Uhrbacteria bacterium]|nr:hypothetical protein [Candidatus Uhrbacteria bacterium]